MPAILIKYFFICFSSFYIYHQITKRPNIHLFHNIAFSFLISCLISLLQNYSVNIRICTMILFSFGYFIIMFSDAPTTIFHTTTISYGLSYAFYTLSSVILGVFLSITTHSNSSFSPFSLCFFNGVLQYTLTYSLLRTKQIKYGLSLLIRQKLLKCGTFFSFLCIMVISDVSANTKTLSHDMRPLLLLITLSLSFFCLYYWRHRITQTYREKLRLANEKSLEDEISALKAEITTLQADNQHLKQIVHKDNKLVPAMEATVMDFLQSSGTLSAEELSARSNELSTALHEMALQRKGILDSLSPNNCGLPTCGLHTVDGLLSYMEKRAKEYTINYRVKIDDNVKDLISTSISEEDLRHLLSDLIENAIIATKCSDSSGQISIHLGILQNRFLLEISDSGIPFTPETYQHFGHEQHTTHTEDCGSGIGLMDIWKIKKKYRASLQIYEHQPSTDIFSKKISFVFDHKNHFLIQTYRDKELQSELTRGDIHIFSYEGD